MVRPLRIVVALALAALVTGAVAAGPAFAANGNSDAAHACQHNGWKTMVDPETGQPFKNQGDCVSSAAHRGSVPSLVVTDTVSADGTSWGLVTGSGLKPGSLVMLGATTEGDFSFRLEYREAVSADGSFTFDPLWECGKGFHEFNASGTTASGDPITSNTIATSPCG